MMKSYCIVLNVRMLQGESIHSL